MAIELAKKRLRKTFRERPPSIFAFLALDFLAVAAIVTTVNGAIANRVATFAYYLLIAALTGPPLLNAIGRKNIKLHMRPRARKYVKVWKDIGRILVDENLGIFICSLIISLAILFSLSSAGWDGLVVAAFSGLVTASLAIIILFERIPEGERSSF